MKIDDDRNRRRRRSKQGRECSYSSKSSDITSGDGKDQLLLSYTLKLLEAKAQLEALEKQEQTLQMTLRQQEVEMEQTMKEAEYTRSSQGSEGEEEDAYHYPNLKNNNNTNYNDGNNHYNQSMRQDESDIIQIIRTEIKQENSHLLCGIKQYISDFMKLQQSQNIERDRIRTRGGKDHNYHHGQQQPQHSFQDKNSFLHPLNQNGYRKSVNGNKNRQSHCEREKISLPSIHERPLMAESEWIPMGHAVR